MIKMHVFVKEAWTTVQAFLMSKENFMNLNSTWAQFSWSNRIHYKKFLHQKLPNKKHETETFRGEIVQFNNWGHNIWKGWHWGNERRGKVHKLRKFITTVETVTNKSVKYTSGVITKCEITFGRSVCTRNLTHKVTDEFTSTLETKQQILVASSATRSSGTVSREKMENRSSKPSNEFEKNMHLLTLKSKRTRTVLNSQTLQSTPTLSWYYWIIHRPVVYICKDCRGGGGAPRRHQ